MQARTPLRLLSGTLIAAVAMTATGCRDTRLEKLSTGISRDSALAIINEGTSGDTLARVYRQESYWLPNPSGNVHVANVLFYNKKGIKEAEDSTLDRGATTPIVLVDGNVSGFGWTYYDSVAKANNLPARATK